MTELKMAILTFRYKYRIKNQTLKIKNEFPAYYSYKIHFTLAVNIQVDLPLCATPKILLLGKKAILDKLRK